ncbi:MAG: hypothetical protein AB7O28_20290 [Vicinamibacterales bacterium]
MSVAFSPWAMGGLAGAAAAVVSAAGNLRRGDPHALSTAPDLATLAVIAVLVGLAVWRSATGHRDQAFSRGRRAAIGAGATFAAGIGAFAWWYFPNHPIALAAYAAVTGFALAGVVGVMTARLLAARQA